MIKRKARVRKALPWAVTLIAVMGLLGGVPAPVVGQANPPLKTGQSAELEEAKRLHQQAEELYNQGQYAAAIPLAERALAIREKLLGQEHPDVAESLNNLAVLYREQGNYAQAEPLFQRALAIREKAFGQEHPDFAESLNNLGELYRLQGNYTQAEPLFQRALAIREKVLGQQHPDFAESLHNLAVLYWLQGNYAQAELLSQRALAIREKAFGQEHRDVAESFTTLAVLYLVQGNYAQAEPLSQRALAILEKVLGQQHPDVAAALINLAAVYKEQGNYAQAEPLFQRALAIYEKVLGPEHPLVATNLNNLADLYWEQGNYAQAEVLYQRALAIREKVLGQQHPDVATSLNNLANLYLKQGNYTQAEPLFQRALAIWEKVLGQEHPLVATNLNNLANLYQNMGNYAQAEPLYQSALAIFEKLLGKEHPTVASMLNNLASLYQAQGNYAQAEPLYQRALAIREKVLGQQHPDVATSLNNLAALYKKQGNYAQAEPLLQRSLAIFEKLLGKEHPTVAISLNNLAVLYEKRGNYAQAELLYQRALAISEKVLGQEHPDVAICLSNLAGLYQAQRNYAQAESLYQHALAIREKALGQQHPDVALSLNNLANLYQNMGNYAQAEPLYQSSLAIYEKVLGQQHPDVAASLNNLATLYWAKGDIIRTLEFLTRSSNIEESNLDLIFTIGSEARKSAYIATLSASTDANISLHIQSAPENAQAARLALTTILQRKGLILDAVSDNLQTLRQNLKPEDQATLDQLATTRSQLAALIFNKPADIPLEQYRQQVATLKAQADQLEDTLFRRSTEFRTKSQPVTIEAIQQLIPADAALVELVLYLPLGNLYKSPKQSLAPRYAAYILHSKGEPQWVDLGEAAPINQAVEDFRKALQSQTSDIKPVARDLDEKLMQPIRKLLGNTRNVLLSPDSQLNLIPFAALVDENNRYLVENYSITYLSSGRDLLRLQNHTQSRQQSVIVANPDYDKPGNPSVKSNPETSPPAPLLRGEGSRSNSNLVPPFPRREGGLGGLGQPTQTRSTENRRSSDLTKFQFGSLPGTAKEAAAITPMLPGVTLLTGSDATENTIKQLQAPKILHIATHGFFLSDVELVAPADFGGSTFLSNRGGLGVEARPGAVPNSPPGKTENPLLRSGIALAGFNPRQSGNEDGVLTALETAGLNLRGTKLVVLSACETGLGDVANGEGVYGLRRALAIAGAESQVISLWKVSDEGTKDLMVSYYKRLMNNLGRSDALRQTQLEMLSNPNYQHPFYWAAFIPSGDWAAMK